MIDPDLEPLLAGFIDESQEICQRAARCLMELESGPAQGPGFDDLARGLHTLKGSAATLGLEDLAEFAHRMEDVILPLRGSAEPIPAAMAEALLGSLDVWMSRLRAVVAKAELPDLQPSFDLLAHLGAPVLAKVLPLAKPAHPAVEAPPAPAPAVTAPPAAAEETWRVSTRQVIELLREVERLREVRLRIDERRREVEKALAQQGPGAAPAASGAETRALLLGMRRSLRADAEEAADIVSSMEEGLKAISTVPVRSVTEPLHRAVRDLCKASGKQVQLRVVGGEVSLDRRVLEQLRGPLVHLIRNAVDHGLELPDVREARGKDRQGALTIRVELQGNMVFIEVADDGAGLDVARIRETALERGILTADELAALTAAQLHQLVFRPGFSTRAEVTEVSGRGVGLDVVRNQILALHGRIELQSVPGQGARFILTLPSDLGGSPVLVVRCGEHQLGLPMAAVESSRLARPSELRLTRSRVQLEYREELIPVQDLGALMGLRQPEAPTAGQPLLIVSSQGRRVALSVDEVLGDRELVIRPLPVEVSMLPAYQGAATLARGELVLILRPEWILSLDQRSETARAGGRRALVVDDSLTARALLRTALESGGYLVHLASGAEHALEQLRHSPYDVMVSDIGMKGMDGFQLTAEVRRQPGTGGMPILLISASDGDANRERGAAAGADGFLTKKDCVSGRLLAEVGAVIERRKGLA